MRSASLIAAALLIGVCAWSLKAEAQLSSCGNIHVEAEAQCEVVGGPRCEGQCTPVSVEAACAAELTAKCSGECKVAANINCQASCQASCTADTCQVDPGKFDCRASCQADCDGTCSGRCASSNNKSECEATCEGTCTASCEGKCDVELPELDCNTKCQASCDGSCEAQANLDCQVECQSELYAECKVEVEGGCEIACTSEEGALFCDGKYVDHGDNLSECVSAIEAFIDANVEGYAEGDASCGGGKCEAEGSAGVSCSALPGRTSEAGLLGLGLLGLVFASRRKR